MDEECDQKDALSALLFLVRSITSMARPGVHLLCDSSVISTADTARVSLLDVPTGARHLIRIDEAGQPGMAAEE
jgi:hypothetical protein